MKIRWFIDQFLRTSPNQFAICLKWIIPKITLRLPITTANILNIHTSEKKRIRRVKGKLHQKNINFFNNTISLNVNYVLKYETHKNNKKTTFTYTHEARRRLLPTQCKIFILQIFSVLSSYHFGSFRYCV